MPIKETENDRRGVELYDAYVKAINGPRYTFLMERLNEQAKAFHQRAPLPPPPDDVLEGYRGLDEWLCLLIAAHEVRARCIPHCFEPHTRHSLFKEAIALYLGNFYKVIARAVDRLVEEGKVEEGWEGDYLYLPAQPDPILRPSERFAILKRDDYQCRLCGVRARTGSAVVLHVDHITPRAKGGTNDPSNLWTLCYQCNRGKGINEL